MSGKTERQHGTVQGYGSGCRCDDCKAAWATYCRDRRRSLGVPTPEESLVAREIAIGEQKIPQLVERDEDADVSVSLTPLEFQILVEIQRRSKKRRGEVIGDLLREHGADVAA